MKREGGSICGSCNKAVNKSRRGWNLGLMVVAMEEGSRVCGLSFIILYENSWVIGSWCISFNKW